jgi:hypothetical protein
MDASEGKQPQEADQDKAEKRRSLESASQRRSGKTAIGHCGGDNYRTQKQGGALGGLRQGDHPRARI